MKKYFSNIRTLAALLMAGAAFAACSSDDNSIEQPANPSGEKTYTLTVNASKGDASTSALALDGTKLVASWAEGDKLSVFKADSRTGCSSANLLGTISPVAGSISADGAKATFTGTLTGTVSNGDKLMLVYHPAAFSVDAFASQTGTLASASALDCATAQVTASVSGSDINIAETSATFTTHTAMLKLTLTTDGTTTINPTALKMSMSAGPLTLKEFSFAPTAATYTANGGDGILYFALPSAADVAAGLGKDASVLAAATITYTATVGSDTYTATKTGYIFAAGKYYAGTLTMVPPTDLSTISGTEYTVQNGEVLTGTLASNVKISIADGATVTLKDVTITNLGDNCNWAGINCPGNATLVLAGTNEVCAGRDGSGYNNYPGIYIAPDKTLTIQGDGTLTAYSNGIKPFGAGIGGGYEISCGNIVINSGNITATGGQYAAGIGSGYNSTCGNITINGGTITSTGGDFAAGIGSGYVNSSCGTITIKSTVTSVTATKGSNYAESIGAGQDGTAITVNIDGVANATTSSTFTNFTSEVSGNTWTLTHN